MIIQGDTFTVRVGMHSDPWAPEKVSVTIGDSRDGPVAYTPTALRELAAVLVLAADEQERYNAEVAKHARH